MEQIHQIYINSFGIAFFWEKEKGIIRNRIQLIFKEIGLYFTYNELKDFNYLIDESLAKNSCCEDCLLKNRDCKYLVKTPLFPLDLSVSLEEMKDLKDLVNGTLFKIELEIYLNSEGRN